VKDTLRQQVISKLAELQIGDDVPALIKFDDPPRIEYVTKDCAVIYNPVDDRFFYLTDMETRKIVGFQFLFPRKDAGGPQPIPYIGGEPKSFNAADVGVTLVEPPSDELRGGFKFDRAASPPSTTPTPSGAAPIGEGYYWARWISAAPGTREGDELTPSNQWSIVEVWQNYLPPDEGDGEFLAVSVTGVETTQWLENFEWGQLIADRNIRVAK
jgi:hypothetical protein